MSASHIAATKNRIAERMERLGVRESDLDERFARSSGPGGQNVNKVSTSVTLTHRPTGVSVRVEESRSQATNRQIARLRLLDELEQQRLKQQQAKLAAKARKRRQNPRRSRAAKALLLDHKRRRGAIKKLRRPPDS